MEFLVVNSEGWSAVTQLWLPVASYELSWPPVASRSLPWPPAASHDLPWPPVRAASRSVEVEDKMGDLMEKEQQWHIEKKQLEDKMANDNAVWSRRVGQLEGHLQSKKALCTSSSMYTYLHIYKEREREHCIHTYISGLSLTPSWFKRLVLDECSAVSKCSSSWRPSWPILASA